MNERIRELAKQAKQELASRPKDLLSMPRIITQEEFAEKFAELLIHECAYTARQCYTVRAADAEDVARHIEETFFGDKQ